MADQHAALCARLCRPEQAVRVLQAPPLDCSPLSKPMELLVPEPLEVCFRRVRRPMECRPVLALRPHRQPGGGLRFRYGSLPRLLVRV